MKKFISILLFLLSFSCANNISKKTEAKASDNFEIIEREKTIVSDTDAYTLLITQKLQEYLDKKIVAKTNPNFNINIENTTLFSVTENTKLNSVTLIAPFETVSDSVKKVLTKIVLEHKTDTILTFIKTSEINIEGEQLITKKVFFDTIK
ncbi:hypothetical protein [Aquimarina longa]|uniref:hypothetical protein n=1 Tax=Aquimarina longa TaxID=1080221 RepID=UPI000782CB9C|nr:hypothetical protein [Aquimarina longa]